MVYVVLLLSWDDMHLRKIFSDESIFVSSSISSANASLLTVCGVVWKQILYIYPHAPCRFILDFSASVIKTKHLLGIIILFYCYVRIVYSTLYVTTGMIFFYSRRWIIMKRSFARYTSTPMYPGLQPPLEMTGSSPLSLRPPLEMTGSSPLSLRPPLETTGSSFLCLRPPLETTDSPAPRSSMLGIQTRRNSIGQSLFLVEYPDPHGSEFIWLSWIRIRIGNADLGALKLIKIHKQIWFPVIQKSFVTRIRIRIETNVDPQHWFFDR